MKSEPYIVAKDLSNQHHLPVSPQNFDPADYDKSNYERNSSVSYQKRLIFSPTTQRKVAMESLNEYPESVIRYEKPESNEDMRAKISSELENNLKVLKSEMLQEFAVMIKDLKSAGKINHDEIQDIKNQITTNRSQFEEIQLHIGEVNQKFTDINSLCVQELEGIKAVISSNIDSTHQNYNPSIASELNQKHMELQFKTLKQNLINDINSLIKTKARARLNENVLAQLKEVKKSFEEDLKENFDQINGRIKYIEENLNRILREKRENMESSKHELFGILDSQEKALVQELQQLKMLVNEKLDEQQAKVIIKNEINNKLDYLLKENRNLKNTIIEAKDEMNEVSLNMNQKIDRLEKDTRLKIDQFYDNLQHRKESTSRSSEIIESRIGTITSNLSLYQNSLAQLKIQLNDVQHIYENLKARNNTQNKELISRIESKIEVLKTHIYQIENQIKMKNLFAQPEIRATPEITSHNYNLQITTATSRTASDLEFNTIPLTTTEKVTMSSYPPRNLSEPNTFYSNNYRNVEEKETLKSPSKPISYRSGGLSAEQNQPERYSVSDGKYYGDPKVKSIIDEFYQKRKEIEQKTHERMYSYPTPLLSAEQGLQKSGKLDENSAYHSTRDSIQPTSRPFLTTNQPTNIYADNIINRLKGSYTNPTPISFELQQPKIEPQTSPVDGLGYSNQKSDQIERNIATERKEMETGKSSALQQTLDGDSGIKTETLVQNAKEMLEVGAKQSSQGGSFASANDTDQFQDCKENVSGIDMKDFLEAENSPLKNKGVSPDQHSKNIQSTEKSKAELKRIKHEKINAQINYFIHGTLSHLLSEEDDDEVYCNVDDNGFIYDNEGDFVLDQQGNKVQLTPDQIEKFNKSNMLE